MGHETLIVETVQKALPEGWKVRLGQGVGPAFWIVTAPDGQLRSLMGLQRLTELQIRNRVQGVVSRFHLGARAK